MSTQTINVATDTTSTIKIGYEDESAVTQVIFNLSSWVSEYGEGTATLLVKRSTDTEAYPVALTVSNNVAAWTVTDTDTSVHGWGEAQVTYTVGTLKKKSAVYGVFTDISIRGSEGATSPYENWAESINNTIGNLSDLETTNKSNIVSAINEVAQSGGTSPLVATVTVSENNAVLDKTWQEIHDAFVAGGVIVDYSAAFTSDYILLFRVNGVCKLAQYVVDASSLNGGEAVFYCDSATDYPTYSE